MTMMTAFQKSLSFATFSTDTVPSPDRRAVRTEQFEVASRGELQMVVNHAAGVTDCLMPCPCSRLPSTARRSSRHCGSSWPFPGIGQKKAAMAAEILARDLGKPLQDMSGSDVAYDVHVRRVLLRSGLAEHDEVTHMIAVARALNPDRPGALDLPAWDVGRRWCRPVKSRLPGMPAEPCLPPHDRQGLIGPGSLINGGPREAPSAEIRSWR